MTPRDPDRKALYSVASTIASLMALAWGGAAVALPQTPTVVGFTGGTTPSFTTGASSLTVGQTGSRAVIDWASFNIAKTETVTFNQPSTSAITFNVVTSNVQTTIAGKLTANGGVWLMSPGGVIFGGTAVVSTGSFLASTGNFNATSVSQALNSNNIEIFPQSTVGVGNITVDSGATINATAGFLALQAPTIIQAGALTATDGVVLNALEGMQVSLTPGSSGVLLAGETPLAPSGGQSSITDTGALTGAWIELDAFNGDTAGSGVINLSGHLTATGLKPGGNDSVDLLANFGSTDPTDLVTTINAGGSTISAPGNIDAEGGTLSLGNWTTTSAGFGEVVANAGPGGITASQPLSSQGGNDVDLTATGPISVTGAISSTGSVTLSGDTVAIGPGTSVSAYNNIVLNAPDGVAADPTSSLTAVDQFGDPGTVNIAVGSTASPANLVIGQINAGLIGLASNSGLTQPAGGVSSGPGDIILGGAITTGANGSLNIFAYRNLAINAPVNAQGSTGVQLYTQQGGASGDYSFGPNGSLTFSGAPNSGQSLVINGAGYQLVYSLTDLLNINSNLGGYYALANSLDLANLPNPSNPATPLSVFFTASPIANTSSLEGGAFYGQFAGLGHSISNLNIDQTEASAPGGTPAVGLFGQVGYGGVVRDLSLVNPQVTGGDNMNVGGVAGDSNGTLQNVSVTGGVITGGQGGAFEGVGGLVGDADNGNLIVNSHSSAQVIGGDNSEVGGLVGTLLNGGAVQSSYATGAVTTGDTFGSGAAGGLIGAAYPFYYAGQQPNTVSGSYATGAVTGGQGTAVGGFVGEAFGTSITTSYAIGSVTQATASGQNQAGGFAGLVGGGATITDSWSSGAVNSAGQTGSIGAVGGFVGALQDTGSISTSYSLSPVTSSADSVVGGFAGIVSANIGGPGNPSINGVYATGLVTDTAGTAATGGLVGQLAAGSISNAFWDTSTTGVTASIGQNLTGLAQSNLIAVNAATAYSASTYSGVFDLTNTWLVINGETRPILRAEYSTTITDAHQLELMSLAPGASYVLGGNIDASETSSVFGVWNQANKFVPVGATVAAPFTGVFDGQGYTISNLDIIGTPSATAQTWGAQQTFGALGLFGVEGAAGVVRNVSLANVNVQGGAGMDIGGVAGIAEGQVSNASTSGLIDPVASPTVPTASGGLVGAASGAITSSTSSATVDGANGYAGGLVGWLAPGGSVSASSATGAVTVTDGAGGTVLPAAGGLVGYAGTPFTGATTLASISQSQASGNVVAGADATAGGLVGTVNGATITSSSAQGAVQAGMAGGVASDTGGFAGDIISGTVTNSFATGAASTTAANAGTVGEEVGGFAGGIEAAGVASLDYSTGAVSGTGGAIGSARTTDAGGFAGAVAAGAAASNDYTSSNVTVTGGRTLADSGGFVGVLGGSATDIIASGDTVSTGVSGGLIGDLGATGVATNGVWDVGVSPGTTTAIGVTTAGGTSTGLASVSGASAYQQASYAGFDFTSTWFLISGETRPILQSEYSTTITNAHQLQLMDLNLAATYTLGSNINASQTASAAGFWNPANGFVPVGTTVAAPFTGTLNGNGFTITNLTVKAAQGAHQTLPSGAVTDGAAGLFGFSSGTLNNVILTNATVTAASGMSVGALVGNQLSGTIANSSSAGTITGGGNVLDTFGVEEATIGGLVGAASGAIVQSSSSAIVTGQESEVGGLVGQLRGGSILDSHATGAVTTGATAGVETPAVGGLVGLAENGPTGTAATVQGSYATGAVVGGGESETGGFIGAANGATISGSYETGAVTLNGSNRTGSDEAGGFAGVLSASTVSQSFSSGLVTANPISEFSEVGGFVGQLTGGGITDAYSTSAVTATRSMIVGGFVGDQVSGAVERVYAAGLVNGAGSVGGLVGSLRGGTVADSFWDEGATNQTTGYNLAGGAATNVTGMGGATGIDPFSQSTYGPFDFTNTWSVPSTGPNEYPQLYGVSHVLRLTAEDTSVEYADFPYYTVDNYGFQPLEDASLITGVNAAAVVTAFSSSGHPDVTIFGTPYSILVAGASATSPDGSGAYRFIYVGGNLTVTQRPINAALTGVDKTYDATTDANLQLNNYYLTGAVSGDDVSVASAPTGPGSGTYDTDNVGTGIGVTVNGPITVTGADALNYNITTSISHEPVGEIDPAALEISAVTDSKVYDGTTTSTGTPFVVSGLQGFDTVTGLGQSFDSRNAGARLLDVTSYTINDGNGGNNYTITLDAASGTITPAPLEISAVTDSKVYDGTTNSTGAPFVVGGLVFGDSVSSLVQSFDSKNAGARLLEVTGFTINDGNGGNNYSLTLDDAAGTITPAPLTLAAVTDSKVYDGTTNSSATPTDAGLVAGDTISNLSESYDSKNAGARILTVGSGYVINDGNGGNNYTLTVDTTASGTITPAPLEISAVTDSKVYDGTTTSTGTPFVVSGLVSGDSVSDLIQSFDSKNAGNRLLTVTNFAISDGNGGNNYSITLDDAAGTITPAPLEISAVTDSKVYDGTTTSTGAPFVVAGLASGDSVSGLIQSFDSKNAGNRLLSVTNFAISDGNGGNNYNVTLDDAAGIITPAPLTLAAVTDTKIYDGTTTAAATPTDAGLIAGDTISGLSEAFDSRNAGARILSVAGGYVINDGNAGNNYVVTVDSTAPGTINPAPLTLAAVTDSKVYDGTTTATATPTDAGLIAGDTISGLSEAFDSKNAGARTLTASSGYVINDGNGGNNYVLTVDSTAPGTISPAPLTLAAVTDTKTYDGTTAATASPTDAGLVSGDTISGLSETFDSKNAGARVLSVSPGYVINDGNGGANYVLTVDSTAPGTINPAPLTLAAVPDTKVYDGTTTATATPSDAGLVAGDTISGLFETFDSKNAGARTLTASSGYVINDGNGGNNYVLTVDNTAPGTITPAPLTLAAVPDTKVYDGTTTATATPTDAGLVAGDTISGLFETFDSKNAGARTLTASSGYVINDGNGGNNYVLTVDSTAPGTITPAPLEISAVSDSKVYDGATASTGAPFVVSGLVQGDSVSDLIQSFDSKNAGARLLEVSGYAISDGNGGANYAVTLDDAAGTITPAPLQISAVTDSKVYDGATTSTGTPFVVSGLVSGDSVSDLIQSFDSRNAGNRILSVTNYAISDGNGGANYSVTLDAAAGTITPAPLTLAAVTDTKTYDGTTAATATPSDAGLVSGDTISGLFETFDSKNAGARILTASSGYVINDGNGGNNYVLTVDSTAPGTITPAPLEISAVSDSKVYDGTTASSGAPFVVSGLVQGDSVSELTQSFDSKNAGARLLEVGGYSISDGNEGGNYAVTLDTAQGTITPAPLTLTATSETKVYDGTTTATATPTVSGLVEGDSVSNLSEVFDNKNAGPRVLTVVGGGTNPNQGEGGPPTETAFGGFVISDGNGGNNYAVTLQSAAGAITPKPLTVGLTGDIFKIYDGTAAATVPASDYRLSGLIAGDSVTLNAPSQGAYDTPYQGTGKTVTVTGFTLSGAEAEDYSVTGSASAQIGTICLAGCVLPPVYSDLLVVPGLVKTYQLQFGFLQQFPFGGDFPLAPDDDSSPKGDVFPVTGAGNRDLWSGPSTESSPGCPPGGSDTGACQGHTP